MLAILSTVEQQRLVDPAEKEGILEGNALSSSEQCPGSGSSKSRQLNIKLEQLKSELRENRKLDLLILQTLQEQGQVNQVPEEEEIPEGILSLPLDSVQDLEEANLILQDDPAKRKQMVTIMFCSY